jgi:hypothetical protein
VRSRNENENRAWGSERERNGSNIDQSRTSKVQQIPSDDSRSVPEIVFYQLFTSSSIDWTFGPVYQTTLKSKGIIAALEIRSLHQESDCELHSD